MAWIGGAIAAVGSLVGGSMSNDANSGEASANRAFQMDMSDTAYRRAVNDLKYAGINPMMVTKLGGASTPAGNQAQVNDVISPAISSAVNAYRATAEIEKVRTDTELSKAQADRARAEEAKIKSETLINAELIPKIQAETLHTTNSAANMEEQTRLTATQRDYLIGQMDKIVMEMGLIENQTEEVKARTWQAVKQGELAQMQGLTEKQRAAMFQVNALLMSLGVPKAKNEANAQGSAWMENVSPYLRDILGITNSAAGFSRFLNH